MLPLNFNKKSLLRFSQEFQKWTILKCPKICFTIKNFIDFFEIFVLQHNRKNTKKIIIF
jgi:hypothetical protein